MDFDFNEEQEAVRGLADRIFSERATHERLKQVEAAADERGPFDRELWTELANAGLVGIALGEDVGGAGLDFLAVCLVAEAAGQTAAYVPVVETMVLGADTIERHGTPEQRQRWLPGVASGATVLTASTAELVGDLVVPDDATARAVRQPSGSWRLEGTKACVAAGMLADVLLLPVTLVGADGEETGRAVVVVEAGTPGITRTAQDPATRRTQAIIELDGAEVGEDAILGGPGADGRAIVADLRQRATAALCVVEAGACAAAVALIAEYTKSREQFGKPIATFQAVGQRAADAYVDAEAVKLTAWQAAWRLSVGLPAEAEVAIAKFWAADGGERALHAAQHLHGGIGVDRDYPLHRYFLLTEEIELTLGHAASQLRELGAMLAAEPV